MKNTFYLILALFLVNITFAQVTYEYGDNFEYDTKAEQDPKFVLKDNYNHYMLSVVIVDGMMARRQMIMRKFDQKNQMVEMLTYDFPKFDIATLYNYLGYAEANGKVAVFTQTYSNKAKKSVISVHVFDKATSQFTTTELNSTPILSAMKSGTVSMQTSDNGRNIGINYTMHQAKEEAEKNLMLLIDATTFSIIWQKEFAFTDKFFTKNFTVTNSARAVYLRKAKGMKQSNYLVLGSPDGQEEKMLETEILLHSLKAVSIGSQDYVLAFNHPLKGLRSGDYTNLLLYDLQTGKTIQNAKSNAFGTNRTVEVQFQNVSIQNNEIHIFAEAKVEADTKPAATTGGFGSSFPETVYHYNAGYLIVMGLDGTIKKEEKLNLSTTVASLHHSYGLLNIKGNYYIHTGAHTSLPTRFPGLFALNAADGYNMPKDWILSPYAKDPKLYDQNVQYVHQLVNYFPDSNRLLFARIVNGNEMSLVNVFGMK